MFHDALATFLQWNERSDHENDNHTGTLLRWLFTVLFLLGSVRIVGWWNISNRSSNSNSSSNTIHSRRQQLRYGMPYIQNSPEGSSYPFLGHGLTFWRHTPWDLLSTWHRRGDGTIDNKTNDLNDTTASSSYSSSSPPQQCSYHPIISFPLMGTTYFSVASPSLCKAMLQGHVAHVHKDIQVTMKPFLSILGTGMVSSEGRHWLQQRLHLSNALRRDILEAIPRQTLLAVQLLCHGTLDPATATAKPVPLGSLLRHLTLQVISGAFLSLSAEESDAHFAVLYLPIVAEANRRVWHPYRSYCFWTRSFWQYRKNVARLNTYVSQLIQRRWALRQQESFAKAAKNSDAPSSSSKRPQDILDTVLHAYEERKLAAQVVLSLSTSEICQIRDEMKTFMLAGHETSAAMMTWTLYELILSQRGRRSAPQSAANDPSNSVDWMDLVTTESNRVFETATLMDTWRHDSDNTPDQATLPSAERLAELVVAEASLKESLRKYNVVPTVARRVVQDLHLEEGPYRYFIPKGSSILINIQSVHLNPHLWPQPMKYDPSRFLNAAANSADLSTTTPTIQPFTYLPFIAGPRNCLGQHLALLESKMVIALLTQRYTFTLTNPLSDDINPEDWSQGHDPRHRFMVPVIPKDELLVTVSRN